MHDSKDPENTIASGVDKSIEVYMASTRNNSWTTTPVTIKSLLDKGAKILPSRLVGDYTLWVEGINMAALFVDQKAQLSFLSKEGLV